MAMAVTVLGIGDDHPRPAFVTRLLAFKVFCDCFKHAYQQHRDSWTFVIALDRDDLTKLYVKRSDTPDTAPWREVDAWGPIQVEVCGAKVALDGMQFATDRDGATLPWWPDRNAGFRNDAAFAMARKKREELAEWNRLRAEGLVDGTEPNAPKDFERNEVDRKKKRKEDQEAAKRAQPELLDTTPPTPTDGNLDHE